MTGTTFSRRTAFRFSGASIVTAAAPHTVGSPAAASEVTTAIIKGADLASRITAVVGGGISNLSHLLYSLDRIDHEYHDEGGTQKLKRYMEPEGNGFLDISAESEISSIESCLQTFAKNNISFDDIINSPKLVGMAYQVLGKSINAQDQAAIIALPKKLEGLFGTRSIPSLLTAIKERKIAVMFRHLEYTASLSMPDTDDYSVMYDYRSTLLRFSPYEIERTVDDGDPRKQRMVQLAQNLRRRVCRENEAAHRLDAQRSHEAEIKEKERQSSILCHISAGILTAGEQEIAKLAPDSVYKNAKVRLISASETSMFFLGAPDIYKAILRLEVRPVDGLQLKMGKDFVIKMDDDNRVRLITNHDELLACFPVGGQFSVRGNTDRPFIKLHTLQSAHL